MEPKKIALLVGALVIAAVTAFMARSMFAQSPTPIAQAIVAPAPTGPEVLVATRALPVGTILTPDAFRYQPWPKDLIENAYYAKGQTAGGDKDGNGGITDPSQLNGTVVRSAISAGQPLTQGSIVHPGDRGFLAAALSPGMRAVTIRAEGPTATVGGFVFPGDRIDLMLSQSMTVEGDPLPLKASETIVRNLRVLATDQRTSKTTDEQGNSIIQPYSVVTLEATPRIAEKLMVAQNLGSLSLSLRSLADSAGELDRAIASGDVNVAKDGDPQKAMIATYSSRPADANPTYVTGADVSRFAKRSAPSQQRPIRTVPVRGVTVIAGPAPVIKVTRGGNTTEVPVGGK